MLCLYFPGAAVVTLISHQAGLPLIPTVVIFAIYGFFLTAFYLLEYWMACKTKPQDESEPSA